MNISMASERTGLPAKTIRYYEEIDLVTPRRERNGYRVFSESDLHKLRFLHRARSLGFSIEECRDLLALYEDRGRESAEVKALAIEHVRSIEAKMNELASIRDTLQSLIDHCAGDHRPHCPILEDLADSD